MNVQSSVVYSYGCEISASTTPLAWMKGEGVNSSRTRGLHPFGSCLSLFPSLYLTRMSGSVRYSLKDIDLNALRCIYGMNPHTLSVSGVGWMAATMGRIEEPTTKKRLHFLHASQVHLNIHSSTSQREKPSYQTRGKEIR